jgi:hypothetical protein
MNGNHKADRNIVMGAEPSHADQQHVQEIDSTGLDKLGYNNFEIKYGKIHRCYIYNTQLMIVLVYIWLKMCSSFGPLCMSGNGSIDSLSWQFKTGVFG